MKKAVFALLFSLAIPSTVFASPNFIHNSSVQLVSEPQVVTATAVAAPVDIQGLMRQISLLQQQVISLQQKLILIKLNQK